MIHKQSGFAIIEGLLILVVVAGLVGGGYVVWHRHQSINTNSATNAKLDYNSPAVTTATAPAVTSTSDLNTALETLNQTDVNASTTDSTQLNNQVSGF